MKGKNDKKRLLTSALIAAILILAAISAWMFLNDGSNLPYMPYAEFETRLNEVEQAALEPEYVEFRLKGEGGKYRTDNPGYGGFKRDLLLAGISVEDRTNAQDWASLAIDGAFDVLFFGIILFGLYKLRDYSRNTFQAVRHTGVRFENIAGMDSLKAEMMQAVDVLKNRERYAAQGIRPVKGIVLEGPPGNGKTLFAKALAEEANVNFIAAKGADFQSAMMSMGARKTKMLFRKAAKCKPCIVFIDEFDSIGERRNYAGTGVDKENNRILTTLLNEMDGFAGADGILVLAATNSYDSLDPALVRPGRFDLKYTVGNPDAQTRRQLIALYTAQKHLSADVRVDNLIQLFEGMSCAAIEALLNEAATVATLAQKPEIGPEEIARAAQKTGARLNVKRA